MTNRALFLCSTPLHSLWSLGIAMGGLPDAQCALALIDQRDGDRDFIAEAIASSELTSFTEVRRFAKIGKKPWQKITNARSRLREVMDWTRGFAPDYVACGNDRRVEFHAALAVAPAAMGAYVDDGTASYNDLTTAAVARSPALRAVVDAFRDLLYGVPTERGPHLGDSRAVKEAWIMLPDHVHDALRQKAIRPIQPEWFQLPAVKSICAQATQKAGLDPASLEGVPLLLALPHDLHVRTHPEVRAPLQQLADRALAEGGKVVIKRHPRSTGMALSLPPERVIEIPQRLPLEIISPLLNGTQVVGMMTSALLYMRLLGSGVQVATLVPPGLEDSPILRIYRAMGVTVLE